MEKLLRWYNQNRKAFWFRIITIILVGSIIWRIFYIFNSGRKKNAYINKNQINNEELNSISLGSMQSVINKKNTTINKEDIYLIDSFFSYCNSQNVQEAYKLVSDECKEIMFNDIKLFNNIYVAPLFKNGKRSIKIENWNGSIYRVELDEDYLSTGKVSKDNTNVDYISTVKDANGNTKLNINSYIGRTNLDKIVSTNGIDIRLIKIDAYMDYEIYTFEVKNNTEKAIILGNIQNDEKVSYLIDKNNYKFNAYVHELAQPQLEVFGKQTKNVSIKYFNEYGSTKVIKSIVFPEIYLNYEEYKKYPNSYRAFTSISIDL